MALWIEAELNAIIEATFRQAGAMGGAQRKGMPHAHVQIDHAWSVSNLSTTIRITNRVQLGPIRSGVYGISNAIDDRILSDATQAPVFLDRMAADALHTLTAKLSDQLIEVLSKHGAAGGDKSWMLLNRRQHGKSHFQSRP